MEKSNSGEGQNYSEKPDSLKFHLLNTRATKTRKFYKENAKQASFAAKYDNRDRTLTCDDYERKQKWSYFYSGENPNRLLLTYFERIFPIPISALYVYQEVYIKPLKTRAILNTLYQPDMCFRFNDPHQAKLLIPFTYDEEVVPSPIPDMDSHKVKPIQEPKFLNGFELSLERLEDSFVVDFSSVKAGNNNMSVLKEYSHFTNVETKNVDEINFDIVSIDFSHIILPY